MNAFHRWACRSARWKTALEEQMLPWTLDGVDLGENLLEVGPGPGLTTDLLRTRFAHMTSVEIDRALAESLQKRMSGSNVRVVRGDATVLPFESGSFSGAVAFTMLHHVPSAALQDKLLAEVCRVLKPGGAFAGIDSVTGLRMRLVHIADTMVTVDPSTFARRLEAAGFIRPAVELRPGKFRFQAYRPA